MKLERSEVLHGPQSAIRNPRSEIYAGVFPRNIDWTEYQHVIPQELGFQGLSISKKYWLPSLSGKCNQNTGSFIGEYF